MPSTARRTANKASSGVNKEHRHYCESKLKQPPPKDLVLSSSSSLTPPRHNQAHSVTEENAVDGAANTNTPSLRRLKRGRGFAKKQHGNSKRRATNNEYPGSAASVSSSNANAAGTGPAEDEVCIIFVLFANVNINASTHVESAYAIAIIYIYYSTQCDNKENCPPVEESWQQPTIDESLPTPLKSTLEVLDACLIPDHARRAVIELFIADAQSERPLNDAEKAILEWLTLLGGDDKGKKFKAKADSVRNGLAEVLESVANEKYRGRVNLGDVLQELLSLIILKHYAPDSCKDYTDGGEYNLIARDNPCIRAFLLLIARSLHKEGGEVWTDDIAKSVNDKIAFTDMRVTLPKSKDTHQSEFEDCRKDCDISPGLFDLIGFLPYATQVKYHYLCRGKPIKVVVASAECYKIWFDKRARTTTTYIIFLAYVPHGQCWAMRLPLMNPFVHRDEMLPRYNERVVAAYEGIVVTPDVSMITHRFGARTGNDLDDDKLIAKMEIMRQWCVKGGNVTKDAWKAVFGGTATEHQEESVYNSHLYKLMMA